MSMAKKNHIVITVIAAILAIVVWILVPTKYAAQVIISDEYKETDLSVGLNKFTANLNKVLNKANSGQNDIEIYSKVLETEDFAKKILQKKVNGTGKTYAEYLDCNDAVDELLSNLNYVISTKRQTLKIQFADKDPLVAAQILDSITTELQIHINRYRRSIAMSNLDNVKRQRIDAFVAYDRAQKAYAAFSDSHKESSLKSEETKLQSLENDVKEKYDIYSKIVTKCVRYEMLLNRSYVSFAFVEPCSVPTAPEKNVWEYILSFVFMANLLTFGWNVYQKRKPLRLFFTGDAFSPWSLTVGIWAIDILLCYLQQDMLYPIKSKLWYCLVLWIPLFCGSSMIFCSLSKNKEDVVHNGAPHIDMLVYNVLWCVSMCLSPMYLYKVMSIVLQFDTENLLYNIRLLAVSGQGTSLILNAGQAINIALFISSVWLYPKISKFRMATVIIAFLIVEFAMMEKSGILIMILSTMFVLHQKNVVKLRTIAIVLMSTVVLFYFVNMSKVEKDANSATFLDFFGMYVTTPAVAFSYLTQDITSQFGMNTFAQVYQYVNILGFDFKYVERIQEFMFVPIPTNVYTIFQPFYEDFGIIGVGYFAVVYGSLFGWIYGKYLNGNSYSKLLYTYIVEIVIIQFYNENLLQNLFLSVGFVFWTFVLSQRTIVLKEKRNVEK